MDGTADIDLVKHAFALYERGDFAAMFALVAEDAQLHPVFDGEVCIGRDEVMKFFEGDPRRRWRVRDLSFEEVAGRVLVSGRLCSAPALAGPPLNLPIAWLFTTRDGHLTRMDGYAHRQHALRAAPA